MSTSASETYGTILLLGGTGRVASRISKLTLDAKIPTIVASRSGNAPAGLRGVKFDWNDESSYGNAFDEVSKTTTGQDQQLPPIRAVFIVVPPTINSGPATKSFIDFARKKGVARFVLLSASLVEPGGLHMGQTHAYLKELGDRGEVEWAVLRPTWFQENFIVNPRPVKEGKLYSATGEGRIPWVSCNDIAAVAFETLTRIEPPNTDYLVLGPEPITYQELAETFSKVLNRKVEHVNLTETERAAGLASVGVPLDLAQWLAAMEASTSQGSDDRTSDTVFQLTGRQPRTFRSFVEAEKESWM